MFIQLDSQIIYYERTGEGHPLILLHGNGGDHTMYNELVDALSDTYEIYAVDTRGHGGSATPKAYHYGEMAADITKLIKALDIKKPAILGFSDGAILAMIIGMEDPDLISHLILCGGNLSPKGLKHSTVKDIKKNFKKTNDPLQKLMLDEPDIHSRDLSRITVPTLVIAGSKDCIKKSETENIAKNIPASELMILPKENHSSYIVNNTYLADKIRDFIK